MTLTLDQVRDVDRLVRSRATYVPDPALRDSWTSYAKDVLAGKRFKGDCDDWAQTAIHILALRGAPKSRLRRALVSSTGEAIDHMIGLVETDDGELWSIGDTFGPPEPVRGDRVGPHKIIQTSRVSEGTRWRAFAGQMPKRETTSRAMELRASETLKDFIRAHEKFVAVAYDDKRPRYVLKAGDQVIGTLTIGFGHTGPDVKIGMKISRAEGERMFEKDLARFERAVRLMVRVDLEQHQFDALVSFAYNCGEANLRKSTLLKKVNAGAPDHEIQREFRRWTRSKGQVMAGLVKRRDHEAAMWAGEVVTHGRITATFHHPDISPEPMVAEDKSSKRSPDTWLAGIGAGTGGVTVWASIQDAVRDFRDTIYDSEMTLLLSLCGVVMAAIGAVLLVKRIAEIRSAKR